jgi:hypothetical protein
MLLYKGIRGLPLLCGLAFQTVAQNTSEEVRPELKGYIQLNTVTRLFLLAGFNSEQDPHSWKGDFGVHFDFALKHIFRRELGARQDVFEKRFLSFLAGYRYITSLGNGRPSLEHRWLVEMTSRFPTAGKLVLIDRSRGEMRFISTRGFFTRYRNKLQAERDFSLGGLRFTPYAYGELYYDTRYDRWNRNRYAIGARFQAGRQFLPEIYFLRQNDSTTTPPHVNAFGVTFSLYF